MLSRDSEVPPHGDLASLTLKQRFKGRIMDWGGCVHVYVEDENGQAILDKAFGTLEEAMAAYCAVTEGGC